MNERTVLIVRVVFLVSCTASTAFAQSPGLEEAGDTREAGEYQYRQEALYFGEQLAVTVVGRYASVSSETVVYQGEMHRKLGDQELFALVNRPDLVEAYNTRRRYATIGIAGGTVVGVGGLIVAMVGDGMVHPRCEFGVTCEAPQAGTGRALVIGGGVVAVAGAVGLLVGMHYARNLRPVEDREMYDLATRHNHALRKKYGLPVVNVGVSPYATDASGGMLVSGQF